MLAFVLLKCNEFAGENISRCVLSCLVLGNKCQKQNCQALKDFVFDELECKDKEDVGREHRFEITRNYLIRDIVSRYVEASTFLVKIRGLQNLVCTHSRRQTQLYVRVRKRQNRLDQPLNNTRAYSENPVLHTDNVTYVGMTSLFVVDLRRASILGITLISKE